MVQISTADKATIYADAVIEALAIAGKEVGGPDINAALSALMFAQAYLIAKIEGRNERRQAIKLIEDNLSERVAAEVNARIIERGRAS